MYKMEDFTQQNIGSILREQQLEWWEVFLQGPVWREGVMTSENLGIMELDTEYWYG